MRTPTFLLFALGHAAAVEFDSCFPFCGNEEGIPGVVTTEAELKKAIRSSNGGSIMFGGDIILTSELVVDTSVVFNANGHTLSSNSLSRCIHFSGEHTHAVLNGLGFDKCGSSETKSGGAILANDGALVILNALIIKESSAVDGGGIGVAGGAHVIMNSGSIANCEATNNGGGFYVDASSIIASSIILNDVEVLGNNARGYGGGGAVFGDSGYTIFNSVSLTSNTAASGAGGIFVLNATNVRVNAGTINKNTSPVCGGVMVTDGSEMTFSSAIITENGGDDDKNLFEGGGICIVEDSNVNLVACKIFNNIGGDVFIEESSSTLNLFSSCQSKKFYGGSDPAPSMVCATSSTDKSGASFSYSYSNWIPWVEFGSMVECAQSYIADLTSDGCEACSEDYSCCGAITCEKRLHCTNFENSLCQTDVTFN